MTLPTFLVIGAMKAGTTTLYERLRSHPCIWMSHDKEPDFFVAEKNWRRGVAWYESQFEPATAVGEASSNYAKFPMFAGVAERAVGVLPEVRVIYIVRHPIERMRSHWLHARSAGWERRSFARAVRRDPQYLDVSRYCRQLEQWSAHVPPERILVRTAEQLATDPASCIADLCRFVGVDPARAPVTVSSAHVTADKPAARRGLARVATRLPAARRVARLVPEPLRAAYGRATTVTMAHDQAALSAAQEAELIEQLQPDVVGLRAYLGAGFDCWGLA